ncbi:MFS transporter [Porticoccaceae bacterium]|nr:MFS transporter [Porticoccaceae bacterium]
MIRLHYRYYLLAMMVLAGTVSFLDRSVFAMAMEALKADLGLSDTQLGFMTGFAFTAFYAVAGVPIARWADRGDRINIASITLGLLGAAVSACGVATSYLQLLGLRACVAVGEAGAVPAGQSLLADSFTRAERPRIMAIYMTFYGFAMVIGFSLGGWAIANYGWRMTFAILGVPALMVAALMKATLREPRRNETHISCPESPGIVSVMSTLWAKKSFRHLGLSFCINFFFSLGATQWLAAFFIRSHNMDLTQLGLWLAVIWAVCGTTGSIAGGALASRLAPNDEAKQLRAVSYMLVVSFVAAILLYLAPNPYVALASYGAMLVFTSLGNGPVFASLQCLAPEEMRSTALAAILLFSNLIGFGLGPLAVGLLSDALTAQYGDEALRVALACTCPGFLWVGIHDWLASRTIAEDVQSLEIETGDKSIKQPSGRIVENA